MTSHTRWFTIVTCVTLIQLSGGTLALAQSSSSAPSADPDDILNLQANPDRPSTIAPRSPQLPQVVEPSQPQPTPLSQDITICGAGEFLSVFSDVRPDHWAYEAVNRLAIGEPRCFPLTPQS